MCKQMDQIKADLRTFQLTGELPPAWEPEPLPYCYRCQANNGKRCGICSAAHYSDLDFDRRVEEINRELDAIESGCAEPPALGWITNIRVGA